MIAATYNCGCAAKSSSLTSESFGLQAPCSPCCFQSYSTLHYSQAQRCTELTIKKPRHIDRRSKDKACCYTDHASRMYSTPSHRPVAISASKRSMSKQFPRSSESKLKGLEMSNMEQPLTEKVVSEIVRKEQPYKEIEAIINDNRVIIRMHKEPVKEEYDPPCECIGQVSSKESALSQKKCDNGVVFDMTHGKLELSRTSREDAPSMERTCEETGCRTVTLYPSIKDTKGTPAAYRMANREVKKLKIVRSIDLEENPNIFLLRVRKHCDSSDKRRTIDLEFRAPRPWLPREKKDILKSEILEEQDADKEYEDETWNEEYEDDEEHEDD